MPQQPPHVLDVSPRFGRPAASSSRNENVYRIREGWLTKRGHLLLTWRRRWFVLDKSSLAYYTTVGDDAHLKGVLDLAGATVAVPGSSVDDNTPSPSPPYVFTITERVMTLRFGGGPARRMGTKVFSIEAASSAERDAWVADLKHNIGIATGIVAVADGVATVTSAVSASSDPSRDKYGSSGDAPLIAEATLTVAAEDRAARVAAAGGARRGRDSDAPALAKEPHPQHDASGAIEDNDVKHLLLPRTGAILEGVDVVVARAEAATHDAAAPPPPPSSCHSSVRVWTGTWNMAEIRPPANMASWLPVDAGGAIAADVVAVGLQESMHTDAALAALRTALGPGFLEVSHRVGSTIKRLGFHGHTALAVWVSEWMVARGLVRLSRAVKGAVALGRNLVVTRVANKAAVAISLPIRLPDASGRLSVASALVFVSCHLTSDASGKTRLAARNGNCADMLAALGLQLTPTVVDKARSSASARRATFDLATAQRRRQAAETAVNVGLTHEEVGVPLIAAENVTYSAVQSSFPHEVRSSASYTTDVATEQIDVYDDDEEDDEDEDDAEAEANAWIAASRGADNLLSSGAGFACGDTDSRDVLSAEQQQQPPPRSPQTRQGAPTVKMVHTPFGPGRAEPTTPERGTAPPRRVGSNGLRPRSRAAVLRSPAVASDTERPTLLLPSATGDDGNVGAVETSAMAPLKLPAAVTRHGLEAATHLALGSDSDASATPVVAALADGGPSAAAPDVLAALAIAAAVDEPDDDDIDADDDENADDTGYAGPTGIAVSASSTTGLPSSTRSGSSEWLKGTNASNSATSDTAATEPTRYDVAGAVAAAGTVAVGAAGMIPRQTSALQPVPQDYDSAGMPLRPVSTVTAGSAASVGGSGDVRRSRGNPLGVTPARSYVLMFGDLNYRVELSAEAALGAIVQAGRDARHVAEVAHGGVVKVAGAKPDVPQHSTSPAAAAEWPWRGLLAHEQLRSAMRCGDALPGFAEPPLTFPPSYRRRKSSAPLIVRARGDLESAKAVAMGFSTVVLKVKRHSAAADAAAVAGAAPPHESAMRTPSYTDRCVARVPLLAGVPVRVSDFLRERSAGRARRSRRSLGGANQRPSRDDSIAGGNALEYQPSFPMNGRTAPNGAYGDHLEADNASAAFFTPFPELRCLSYDECERVAGSDHVPVSAMWELDLSGGSPAVTPVRQADLNASPPLPVAALDWWSPASLRATASSADVVMPPPFPIQLPSPLEMLAAATAAVNSVRRKSGAADVGNGTGVDVAQGDAAAVALAYVASLTSAEPPPPAYNANDGASGTGALGNVQETLHSMAVGNAATAKHGNEDVGIRSIQQNVGSDDIGAIGNNRSAAHSGRHAGSIGQHQAPLSVLQKASWAPAPPQNLRIIAVDTVGRAARIERAALEALLVRGSSQPDNVVVSRSTLFDALRRVRLRNASRLCDVALHGQTSSKQLPDPDSESRGAAPQSTEQHGIRQLVEAMMRHAPHPADVLSLPLSALPPAVATAVAAARAAKAPPSSALVPTATLSATPPHGGRIEATRQRFMQQRPAPHLPAPPHAPAAKPPPKHWPPVAVQHPRPLH